MSADVELGLASRSDLLQILNHTVHGGKSILGGPDASGEGDSRRLDRSLFPVGSQDQIQNLSSNSPATPTSSPGGVFQMDSPANSGLEPSPSALFPISLDRIQSSTSEAGLSDQDYQSQDASTSSGNIFSMTDTAHDSAQSVHSVRQAGPPPSSPQQAQQAQHAQQAQQQPENDYQAQLPAQQGSAPRRKLYAYGIADPEYMSLPCKMSMKHARVTVNHETNYRLYGKKLPGQVNSRAQQCSAAFGFSGVNISLTLSSCCLDEGIQVFLTACSDAWAP